MFRRPRQRDFDAELEAALAALATAGEWVRLADTKAAILAASMAALLVGWLGVAVDSANAASGEFEGFFQLAVLLGLASSVVALIVAASSLHASTKHVGPPNEFSWPHVARNGLRPEGPHRDHARQAWLQYEQLSRIASRKYARFNVALGFAVGGLVLLSASLMPYIVNG